MTDDEFRAHLETRNELTNTDETRRLSHHRSLPVACHDWPVTSEDRARVGAAAECPDPEKARMLASDLLADWQDDRCAVCNGHSDVLDHDHETGLVRGWLCRFCNGQEPGDGIPGGRFDRYRSRNPASILGLTIRYYSPFTGWAEPMPAADPADRWKNNPMTGAGL
jgi:hypothetical protein